MLRGIRRRCASCSPCSSPLAAPHNVRIGETLVEDAHAPREIVDYVERMLPNLGAVERQITFDNLPDQPGLAVRKALLADFGGARNVGFQCVLRRDERTIGARRDVARMVV